MAQRVCTCDQPAGLEAGPSGSRVGVVRSQTPGPLCALFRARCVACRGEYEGPYRLAVERTQGGDVPVIRGAAVRVGDLVQVQLHATPQTGWQRVLVEGVVATIDGETAGSSRSRRRLTLVDTEGRKRTHRVHSEEHVYLLGRTEQQSLFS